MVLGAAKGIVRGTSVRPNVKKAVSSYLKKKSKKIQGKYNYPSWTAAGRRERRKK